MNIGDRIKLSYSLQMPKQRKRKHLPKYYPVWEIVNILDRPRKHEIRRKVYELMPVLNSGKTSKNLRLLKWVSSTQLKVMGTTKELTK